MKSAKYIITISLLILTLNAIPCAYEFYYPSEYYLFRPVNIPETPAKDFNINAEENCLLWQRQTSTDLPLDDIYKLVYKFDIATLNALKAHQIPKEVEDNQMARWLVANDDQEAIDFLILAKNCEWLRSKTLSPWYYPTKNDPVKYSLSEISDVAKQRTNTRFTDRYALQAVRAMTTLKQYEECIRFWNDIESQLPEGLMQRMTLSYVAGAHFQLGYTDEARQLFIAAKDTNGLMDCDLRNNKKLSGSKKMEIIYESYPDCPALRQMAWEILGYVEPDRDWVEGYWYDGQQAEIMQLNALCDKVLADNTPADKALWAYTACYIAHLQGNDRKADQYLKIAEKTVKDQPLANVIKVMRIYIDAQISNYDKAYEQKLFGQLQWLQSMIETNFDSNETESNSYSTLYDLKGCYSFYYWNDAMRCIVLGTVCPKMINAGKSKLALQLANMADYTLLNSCIPHIDFTYCYGVSEDSTILLSMDEYRKENDFNLYDYSNQFATMMDTLSANDLIAYAKVAEKPQTAFDRFLNSHGYIDLDFINEIIGTHCLREMRYADAEHYLNKVAAAYFTRTNVYKGGHLDHDPFSTKRSTWSHAIDAKLHFATAMRQLEQDIAATTDPNRKALLTIDYALGLRNSFSRCWALTHYQLGSVWGCLNTGWGYDEHTQRALNRAEEMLQTALSTCTNDECSAFIQRRMGNFKTATELFPKTTTAQDIKARCDGVRDYHIEKERFW